MNTNEPIRPDDPRLTAYAFGEMEAAEQEQFERLLRQDAGARRQVDEIRALGRELDRAFAAEPLPAGAIIPLEIPAHDAMPKVRRFPYFWVSGLAAACFAIGFVFWQARQHPPVPTRLIEVQLRAPPAAATTAESVEGFAPDSVDSARTLDRVADSSFAAVVAPSFSTFSPEVDTASYGKVRRHVRSGGRPPREAVRIEELVNYFPYDYAEPAAPDSAFAATMEVASAPWKAEHRLVRIGLKAREVPPPQRAPVNLVFLVDVSGSMQVEGGLEVMKRSLRFLLRRLRAEDRIGLVAYNGGAELVLPSTPAGERGEILEAIERLGAGGPVDPRPGLRLAYDVAKAHLARGGVNRVILCAAGGAGATGEARDKLIRMVERRAEDGVFLTVLGVGRGDRPDAILEQLAVRGKGGHVQIDSPRTARRILVEQAGEAAVTIAKATSIEVHFNPAQVQAYRLIGYENRLLRAADSSHGRVEAGEIGAGEAVTALYEIVPAGVEWQPGPAADASGYQVVEASAVGPGAPGRELLTVRLHYREPDGERNRSQEFPLVDGGARFEDASTDFKFAASVAAFGMILRESPHKGSATLADVSFWAASGIGRDVGGHRAEFVGLLRQSEALLR